MEYRIEGTVKITQEECKEFEKSLENKEFDFFRYLQENNAKIKIKKISPWAKKSNQKIIDSMARKDEQS